MNRRGHLSAKVPNVKLRPRTRRHAPLPLDEEIVQRAWDESEMDDDAGPSMSSASNRPWRGITITFTGVEDKPALIRLVQELGGEVESALTIAVTHVVAPSFGSANWINDAHAKWLAGEELDVPASIEAHKLQPFLGLNISISGIEQLDRRKQIISLINENGGVYSKDLDRRCTHLVSAWPTKDPKARQSAKIKWAMKELGDREAGRRRGRRYDTEDLRIVYEEWIWDCVAYAGRWKEEDYDARKPRAQGRVTPQEVLDGSVFERLRAQPLARDEDDDGPVVVRKRKRADVNTLVGELLSTTAAADAAVEVVKAEPVDADIDVEMAEDAAPEQPPPPQLPSRGAVFERKPSLLHASRQTAFATPAGPSRLIDTSMASSMRASTDLTKPPTSARSSPKPIFAGLRFSHAIPEGYASLEDALLRHGAVLVPETERLAGAEVDFVVIRLSSPTRPDPSPGAQFVTECWVEGCCFAQEMLAPESNLVFRPLPVTTPLVGAASCLVHVSGFSTETTVYLRRLLKALGMTLSEKLNRRTTHLCINTPTGLKYNKAKEWGVTVVRDSWLWTMGESGVVEPADEHAHAVEDDAEQAAPGTPKVVLTSARGASTTPSSRALKPTPTHVDAALGEAHVLSPPKVETERLLNMARLTPGRTASAPESPRPSSPRTDLKAATVGGVPSAGAFDSDNVTAALRRLAEGDGAQQRPKLPRRPRPSASRRAEPLPPIQTTTSASASPIKSGGAPEAPPAPAPVEDESMRVTYVDAVAEKERRRLRDLVERGSWNAASPAKRARR